MKQNQFDEEKSAVATSTAIQKDILENADQRVKHVTQEGARSHVISWDGEGRRCSEPRCEVNHER